MQSNADRIYHLFSEQMRNDVSNGCSHLNAHDYSAYFSLTATPSNRLQFIIDYLYRLNPSVFLFRAT